MSIYDRIKAIADEKKMPISAIEKAAGLSNGTVGGWRTSSPMIDSLGKVAVVLGVSIDSLAGIDHKENT